MRQRRLYSVTMITIIYSIIYTGFAQYKQNLCSLQFQRDTSLPNVLIFTSVSQLLRSFPSLVQVGASLVVLTVQKYTFEKLYSSVSSAFLSVSLYRGGMIIIKIIPLFISQQTRIYKSAFTLKQRA